MPLEDFTSYTEFDPQNHLSQASSRSTFDGVKKEESCYLYKDKGEGHFDLSQDFEHLFDFCITSAETSGSWIALWALWNGLGDQDDVSGSSDGLLIIFYHSTSTVRRLHARIWKDGSYVQEYMNYAISFGTTYYAKVNWVASTSTLEFRVYTDPDRTNLVVSLSISKSGVDNLRYIMCPQSATASAGGAIVGYVENLDLQEGGAVVKDVADSFSLSDAVLRGKTLAISDSVGLAEVSLKHGALQVFDLLGLSDAILRGRQFSVFDFLSISELVSVLAELVKHVTDSVGVSDVVGLDKVLLLGDQIRLAENVFVNKVLVVSDGVFLVEVVEKSVHGVVKTRVFLVLGDLAVQLTG